MEALIRKSPQVAIGLVSDNVASIKASWNTVNNKEEFSSAKKSDS